MNTGSTTETGKGAASPVWRWLLLAALLPVAVWVLDQSQRTFRADWVSSTQRRQVLEWVSGASRPASAAEWEEVRAALQAAVDITPENPDFHERLGDAYTVAGQRDWAQPELRRQHFTQAQRAYETAAALRPLEPQTWAMIAAARQAAGAPAAQVQAAWTRAQQLGPHEGHLEAILMQVVLADWEGATPAMQNWATALFDAGNEGVRADINRLAARYGLHFEP